MVTTQANGLGILKYHRAYSYNCKLTTEYGGRTYVSKLLKSLVISPIDISIAKE
jgi:hypothetical protein